MGIRSISLLYFTKKFMFGQVHAVSSTVQTVKERAEVMYEKYAPFQFLAYWYVERSNFLSF